MKSKKNIMRLITLIVAFMPIVVFADEHIGDNFCQETNVINALRVVGYFLVLAKVLVPFIIIGFGILDLAKAVTVGDSDKVTKGVKTIGIRVLIGILIFALPSIIDLILDGVSDLKESDIDYEMCQTCLLDPWSCENGQPTDIYDSTDIFEDPSRVITQGTETTAPKPSTEPVTTSSKPSTKPVTTAPKPSTEPVTTSKKNTSKIFIQVE